MTPDMKRIFAILSLLTCLAAFSFAQNASPLRPRMEIADYEVESDATIENKLEVFYLADESPRMYYLSVGNLGVGTDIVQINFDPIFELFIPLGNTLDEAMQKLELLKETCKADAGTTIEMDGCLALGVPNENLETVTVTSRRFLFSKLLAFSVERDGWIRASHVSRSSLNSIVASLKLYRKIHPNEE